MSYLLAVKRLMVCDELEKSNCGSLLFYCQISPPVFESLPPNYGVVPPNHHLEGANILHPGGNGHTGIIKPGMCRSECVTFTMMAAVLRDKMN